MLIGKAVGTLRLTGKTETQIQKSVGSSWLKQINARVRKRLPQFTNDLREALSAAILNSDEVQTIINDDDVRGQLGLPDPLKNFTAIANAVSESLSVRFRNFRMGASGNVSGKLEVVAAPKDSRYLLKLPEAYVDSFSWLDALLSGGDQIYISGHQYMSRNLSAKSLATSRTGLGLMIKNAGRGWSVPNAVSGVEDNNLLTRALQSGGMKRAIDGGFKRLLLG